MTDATDVQRDDGPESGVDLALVSRIERELDAVERALEQVDQGVYEGFTGLGDAPATADEDQPPAPPTVSGPEPDGPMPAPGSAEAQPAPAPEIGSSPAHPPRYG